MQVIAALDKQCVTEHFQMKTNAVLQRLNLLLCPFEAHFVHAQR